MTRWKVSALSIPAFLLLGSTEPTLAAKIGMKCQVGNVNISVSGGECVNLGNQIKCSNSKGDSAVGNCDASGKADCGDSKGSGACVISRKVTGVPRTTVPTRVVR
jgi:hypothetical protein